jgi:ubiquinone/menaquinone biosynthesis C-methylase UbiE
MSAYYRRASILGCSSWLSIFATICSMPDFRVSMLPIASAQPRATSVAIYTKPILALYDSAVLGFSNRYAWRCPSAATRQWYTSHITANHLDIGVGTGYFLARCSYPAPRPRLTLLDRNPNSLQRSAKRLALLSCYSQAGVRKSQ